jgi:hypothetical protein
MYQCNLCERNFSRKQDLTQHCRQLHSNTKHSRTLSWIQDQQLLNSNTSFSQALDNNIWDEFEGFDIFPQTTSFGNKRNNEVIKQLFSSYENMAN